jgi:hypothetical protein
MSIIKKKFTLINFYGEKLFFKNNYLFNRKVFFKIKTSFFFFYFKYFFSIFSLIVFFLIGRLFSNNSILSVKNINKVLFDDSQLKFYKALVKFKIFY